MEFAGRGLAHGRREVGGEAIRGGHRGERRRGEGSGAVWSVNEHGGRGGRSVLKKMIRGVKIIVKMKRLTALARLRTCITGVLTGTLAVLLGGTGTIWISSSSDSTGVSRGWDAGALERVVAAFPAGALGGTAFLGASETIEHLVFTSAQRRQRAPCACVALRAHT
jgi:hypothetical protein